MDKIMNQLKIFEREEFGQVRVIERKGEPWFVAKDICLILDLDNVSQALSTLDIDEKSIINNDTLNNTNDLRKDTRIISESGMYMLIMRSRKPEAKPFRKWVTSEVLPAIRKTGSYSVIPQTYPELLRAYADECEAKEKAIALAEEKIVQLDESKTWVSLKRYNFDEDMELLPKQLSTVSRKLGLLGYERKKIFDVNYGEVWAYRREELDAIDFDAMLDL